MKDHPDNDRFDGFDTSDGFDTDDTSDNPDGLPIWRPLPTKLHAYEAIYLLNRSFQAALLTLERLDRLGMFSLEYLNETKIRLEVVRADLNEELTSALQDIEQNDGGRFSRMQHSLENQRKNPAEAFLQAGHREREIKEQIKELQHSLEFRKPKAKKKAGK